MLVCCRDALRPQQRRVAENVSSKDVLFQANKCHAFEIGIRIECYIYIKQIEPCQPVQADWVKTFCPHVDFLRKTDTTGLVSCLTKWILWIPTD